MRDIATIDGRGYAVNLGEAAGAASIIETLHRRLTEERMKRDQLIQRAEALATEREQVVAQANVRVAALAAEREQIVAQANAAIGGVAALEAVLADLERSEAPAPPA